MDETNTKTPITDKTSVVTAFHSGDLGDIVYAMPVFKEIAKVRGPLTIYLQSRHGTKEMTVGRFDTIKGLLISQPYIKDVTHGDTTEEPDYDFSTFRRGGMPWGKNITELQSRWVLGKSLPYSPWIDCKPDVSKSGRIILHRSPRYRNTYFDWRAVAAAAGDKALSICPEHEHRDLEEAASCKIDRIDVKDFYELACILKGCEMFIGNQSSPMAVAIGVGAKSLQETCPRIPDCIYKGAPITYSTVGEGEVNGQALHSRFSPELSISRPPPGGWVVTLNGETYKSIGNFGAEKWLKSKGFKGDCRAETLRQNLSRVLEECPQIFDTQNSPIGRLRKYLLSLEIGVV